jgi:hypothetical protein
LPQTECAVKNIKIKQPKLKVGGVCFWAMYAYNAFKKKFSFGALYECLKVLRRVNFCTTYSVYVEKVLPHTQYTRILSTPMEYFLQHTQYMWENVNVILSLHGIFFTAYSAGVGIISKICHPALLSTQ